MSLTERRAAKLVEQFHSLPGNDGIKKSVLGYDRRLSTYGCHHLPDDPYYVLAMAKAGLIAYGRNGWMSTKKGRDTADALGMHEGCITGWSRGRHQGDYQMRQGRLHPVRWDRATEAYVDREGAVLVWRGYWAPDTPKTP